MSEARPQLYYHPHSRAMGCVWMLEEVGVSYDLRFVDFQRGEQRSPELLALNAMGKIPVLVDGDAVISESAAIALYLADRYAPGDLAPALDDPLRGSYLRWILFAPSVIEPAAMAKASGWEAPRGSAGWGDYESMVRGVMAALKDKDGPWLLGERFSMADVVFGGTLGFMLAFNLIDKLPEFEAYVAGLMDRPARQRADKVNAAELAKLPPPPSAS
ncbi:MAG: glutathione S-transferase [Myxococcales bacterium]|nr:glutathione S-transferase [Myxococcales bacterium]